MLVGEIYESARGAKAQLATPVDAVLARPAVPFVIPIMEVEPHDDVAHGNLQSTTQSSPLLSRSARLAREKGLEPKKPRSAESGEGCGE